MNDVKMFIAAAEEVADASLDDGVVDGSNGLLEDTGPSNADLKMMEVESDIGEQIDDTKLQLQEAWQNVHDDEESEGPSLDIANMYLSSIGKIRLLTKDEEFQLGTLVQKGVKAQKEIERLNKLMPYTTLEGDKLSGRKMRKRTALLLLLRKKIIKEHQKVIRPGIVARNRFVEANLRLVVHTAKKYMGPRLSFIDLVQEGNLGLMRAAEKFDPERGFKFSTYATWWIKQAFTRALADSGAMIRVPVHVHDDIRKMGRAEERLLQRLHRHPTPEEIVDEMNCMEEERSVERIKTDLGKEQNEVVTPEELQQWKREKAEKSLKQAEKLRNRGDREITQDAIDQKAARVKWDLVRVKKMIDDRRRMTILSTSMPVGDEESTLGDFLASQEPPADEVAIKDRALTDLGTVLRKLHPREEVVIKLRFAEEKTLEEVGDMFGLTRERIRQIEVGAKAKLAGSEVKKHLLDMEV